MIIGDCWNTSLWWKGYVVFHMYFRYHTLKMGVFKHCKNPKTIVFGRRDDFVAVGNLYTLVKL